MREITVSEAELLRAQFALSSAISLELIAEGDNAKCFLASATDTVYRMPMADVIRGRTPGELELLTYLQEALHGQPATPRIAGVGRDGLCHCYPLIAGEILTRDMLAGAKYSAMTSSIAGEFSDFLARLHALDVPDGLAQRLPKSDTFDDWRLMKDLVKDSVLEYLMDDVISAAEVCWWAERRSRKVLLHNDFASGNLILVRGKLAGVIDWTNAYIGSAYLEYRQLWLVNPHFARQFTPAQYWPAVAAAAFLRGVRLTLCEPDMERRHAEMIAALRVYRQYNRWTVRLNRNPIEESVYADVNGAPVVDIAKAIAFDRRDAAQQHAFHLTKHIDATQWVPLAERPHSPQDQRDNVWNIFSGEGERPWHPEEATHSGPGQVTQK